MADISNGLPPAQGLYDPNNEHDACGVGFVVNMKGKRSHETIRDALKILVNLLHRGACGCEANTGDGAGILIQIPHTFFKYECWKLGFTLPEPGEYGIGTIFLPRDEAQRKQCESLVEKAIVSAGQKLLGWRDVPTNNSKLGKTAVDAQPVIRHVFIGRSSTLELKGRNDTDRDDAFERRLFLIRKDAGHAIANSGLSEKSFYYVPSLSCRTIIYKGMLIADQIESFYPELCDPLMDSALALVHQRFSTNTFPSWSLAHPFRYLAHNGEINTLRGNVNWMRAREALFETEYYTADEMKRIIPVVNEKGSDSAILDQALETLVMCGRSLPHAMMMLIPEAWSGHESMSQEKKDFYQFHSCMMEP